MIKLSEIKDEVLKFTSSKTLDALIGPSLFLILNAFIDLKTSIIISMVLAFLVSLYRIIKSQKLIYSFGGLLGVIIASSFAYFAGNAASYFLPKIISSAFLLIASIVSLIIGRPLAIIVSHISRGWELNWYLRGDIKPAYTEVTIVWMILILVRLLLQISLFRQASIFILGWASIILGMPMTLTVLILSLIYGLFRLKTLKGPSIEEFRSGKEAPWEGQKRGF